jgi:hypothetical protein
METAPDGAVKNYGRYAKIGMPSDREDLLASVLISTLWVPELAREALSGRSTSRSAARERPDSGPDNAWIASDTQSAFIQASGGIGPGEAGNRSDWIVFVWMHFLSQRP